eukprot:863429-Pyramimonas_sp.AAC.1
MGASTSMKKNERALDQGRLEGMRGAAVAAVHGLFGDGHELAQAANSGTMIDGMLIILLDIGSNINSVGLQAARTFQRVSHARGNDVKRLNMSRPLYVARVGAGAAACRTSGHCKIAGACMGQSCGATCHRQAGHLFSRRGRG